MRPSYPDGCSEAVARDERDHEIADAQAEAIEPFRRCLEDLGDYLIEVKDRLQALCDHDPNPHLLGARKQAALTLVGYRSLVTKHDLADHLNVAME